MAPYKMADSDTKPSITNKDNHSSVENEPKTLDTTDSNRIIEIDIPNDGNEETEIKHSDFLEHNNVTILGKNALGVTQNDASRVMQNDSVQENGPSKRISARELKFLGVTEIKEEDDKYDVFGDDDKIYKKYRLRESTNKPNYKIPSVNDLPKIEEKPNDRNFLCPHCNEENENKKELRYHIRTMHKMKYTCSQCLEIFESNEKLISHKEIHETDDCSHICHECKVAFSNHFDYLFHMFKQHTLESTFKCAECELIYNRKTFQKHMITHFKRAHSCPKCNKKFQTEMQLKDHLELDNHDIRTSTKYQCVECDQILSEKRYYDYHMSIHIGLKPFQCLYCGKGFRTNQQRKIHTRIHTQERPYSCTKCDQKFIQSTDLQRHLIGHDKVKNFQCEVCQKKYINKYSLSLHKKIHSKKYDCPDCEKSFPLMTNLRNHALYQHSTERLVECRACNKRFATNSHLSKHKSTKAHKRQEYRLKLEKETDI